MRMFTYCERKDFRSVEEIEKIEWFEVIIMCQLPKIPKKKYLKILMKNTPLTNNSPKKCLIPHPQPSKSPLSLSMKSESPFLFSLQISTIVQCAECEAKQKTFFNQLSYSQCQSTIMTSLTNEPFFLCIWDFLDFILRL